jgi:rhodanese-related sulfurtransferase
MPVKLPLEITPRDVKRLLDAGEKLRLIDVREIKEHNICRIEAAELIPMNTIPQHLTNLSAQAGNATLIVFCHHGGRSLNVINWLRQQGVAACQNMTGGIDRWSREIDPSVPRY